MLNQYRESIKLQEEGAPVKLAGMTFWIRRANEKWDEALVEAKRYVAGINYVDSQLTAEQHRKAVAIAYSEYLIAKWENVRYEEDGKEVPFNPGTVVDIFSDAEYVSLASDIFLSARNRENYLYENLKKDIDLAKK